MAGQDTQHARGADAKPDVRHEVAQRLIEAMESGGAPWQRPWSPQDGHALRPTNPITKNGYRGINRILLSLSGRSSNFWLTYKQAEAQGWQVKQGEKGTMIVKVVEMFRERDEGPAGSSNPRPQQTGAGAKADENIRKAFALRRYFVFNAEQVEGMPAAEEQAAPAPFDAVEQAEAVLDAMKQTGLKIIHGGDRACYVPSLDEVRLPARRAFKTAYDYYGTANHELCHSSMAPHRLNRAEAYAKKWGDSAYALEELTVEIGAAILQSELGVATSPELAVAHLEDHAKYLRSWIRAIENDPIVIFTAAKNAEKISEYVLGLTRQRAALEPHKEWLAEHELAPALARAR